jgi:hypothetical protein
MWRVVAKDGFTRPASQSQPRPAVVALGAGETYDLEVTPAAGSSLKLAYQLVAPFPPELQQRTVVQIRVR